MRPHDPNHDLLLSRSSLYYSGPRAECNPSSGESTTSHQRENSKSGRVISAEAPFSAFNNAGGGWGLWVRSSTLSALMSFDRPAGAATNDASHNPLTVRGMLRLDPLKLVRVVAGTSGLDRTVRWIHVIDIPEISPWVHGEEVLLTTGYRWSTHDDASRHTVRQLNSKGLAGILRVFCLSLSSRCAAFRQACSTRPKRCTCRSCSHPGTPVHRSAHKSAPHESVVRTLYPGLYNPSNYPSYHG